MKKIAKKRTTPEHRAERRLNQAMRREASYEVGARAGKATDGREANLDRIKRLKDGGWPASAQQTPAPQVLSQPLTPYPFTEHASEGGVS
jgi:hypothetical protein